MAVAAGLGGTSGLLGMMQLLNRKSENATRRFQLVRSWPWIITGVFGPILHR